MGKGLSMEHHVWIVASMCVGVLCLLLGIGVHLKTVVQPRRAAESASRKMALDKFA